ncbi:MAG: histone deacetylase [Candidatus Latescibacteria bacterium]|nr:histone deacetylase [Candidatus Latescibacterota bacterium]
MFTDPSGLAHDTGRGHPERPGRLAALERLFAGLDRERFPWSRAAEPAAEDTLLAVHTAGHLQRVRALCAAGPGYFDPDTPVVPASWDAALRAAGATAEAARAVARGDARRAFVAVRPPGHHAEPGRAMGFCLFNNVAVAARALQDEGLAGKVAIVDFDVHHGNGTQEAFWEDPSVLYASCHQSPLFPGTGRRNEVGAGPGLDFTVNRPLTPGSGDEQVLHWVEGELTTVLRHYKPNFMLVSAGYDAHAADPLAQLEMSTEGYRKLTAHLAALADELCDGRLVATLEGGYELGSLTESVAATLESFAG